MSGFNADSRKLLQAIFGTIDGVWLVQGRYDANDRLVVLNDGPAVDTFGLHDHNDLYYCVSRVGPGGRKDPLRVMVLVIDDVGKELDKAEVDAHPFLPEASFVVESSRGSFQYGYIIDGGMAVEEYDRLRAAMKRDPIIGKAHGIDAARIFRLPQGTHTKAARGWWKPRLVGGNWVKYSVAQLTGALGGGAPAIAVGTPSIATKRFEWTLSDAALQALVDLIPNPPETARETWIDILHGIAGAGGAFEVWDSWSSRWAHYDAADTRRAWDTLDMGQVKSGGGLLRVFAEAKDPKGFAAWRSKWEAKEVFSDDAEVAAAEVAAAGGGAPNAKQLKYAQEVAARYGSVIRWNVDRGAWAVFGGGRWTQLEPGVKRAYQISVNMAAMAGARGKGDADVQTAQFHNGVEDLCRQWPALQVREKEFDVDPWLLGTPSGVVDLRTGVMRAAAASDMISKQTAAAPNSGGCPRWMRFLDEVTQGDLGSKLFLQQWAGYCLTGETTEQVFLFIHGPGGNGKSVFADTLRQLWADYAVQPVGDLFVKKAHGMGHTSKLAMLAGARLCTVQEVPAGAQWDEGLLKDVTGGGAVTASFKHKNEFTFQPLFKLMAMGNHQPTFPGGISPAIKRRFRMMEFGFVPRVVDAGLMKTLRGEWPGILRWAIDGALAWVSGGGLIVPDAVSETTKEFFEEQDLPGRWLGERVEKSKGSKVQTSDLFRDWIEWRNRQGNTEELNNQTAFGREMTERRGLVKNKLSGVVSFEDIKLKSRAAAAFDEN